MAKSKTKEMTISEASAYYDDHDIFESEGAKEITEIQFILQKKKYIELDIDLFNKISIKAKKLHKSEELLIKEWLIEKVG